MLSSYLAYMWSKSLVVGGQEAYMLDVSGKEQAEVRYEVY